MIAEFGSRLYTVLSLRVHLYARRLRSRGVMTRIAGYVGPLAGLLLLLFVGRTALGLASIAPPVLVAGGAVAVMAGAHLMIFLEVVARVGRGEGMAAALYHYPLSPALVHAAEMLTGALSPGLMLASVILIAASVGLAASPGLAVMWMLLGVVYLLGLRQLLQLALATLLRRRWLREVALALVSMVGIGFWLGANWLGQHMSGRDVIGWLEEAPTAFWLLPMSWFVTPFADIPDLDPWIRIAGLTGAPLLAFAVFVVGFDLQDAACYGESPTLLSVRGARRRRKRWHVLDRRPFRWVPPAVWATAGKEVRIVRRDPFLIVMLLSQGLILLAPALIFPGMRAGAMGAGYLPFFTLLLLFAEHTPMFNLIGLEGRALHFLAQTPVSRWHVLMGKNLAYACVFAIVNLAFLVAACGVFGALDRLGFFWGLSLVGLFVLLGVGNFVSAFLPMPWVGARAAAGGSRSAAAAADGGIERPGCGTMLLRMVFLQGLTLLMLPVMGGMYLCKWLLPASGWIPTIGAIGAYAGLIYVIGTFLAVSRLEAAEEKLLTLVASRSAA